MKTSFIMGTRHLIQTREFFLELLDRLPARLSRITEPLIRWVKTLLSIVSEFSVDALDLRVRVNRDGEPLLLLFIGSKRRLPFLMGLVGTDDCKLEKSERLFFWEVKQYIRKRDQEADLVVLNVNKVLFRLVRPEGYLRIPECVQSTLMLQGSFEEVEKRFHRSGLRKATNVRARGYRCEVLRDETALNHFYHEMYVPYVGTRFGALAVIDSYYKVRRLFRTGFLVAVRNEDEYLSAAVCRIRGNRLTFELIGIEKGELTLLNKGAMDALYYYCIMMALEKKCTMINFGNSRPFLNDGILLYKRKWGSVLVQNRKQYREIGIRCTPSRKAGDRFLLENYPVFLDGGGLSALISSDGNAPLDVTSIQYMIQNYYDPGLARLVLLSPHGFDERVCRRYGSGSHERVTLVTIPRGDWEAREHFLRACGGQSTKTDPTMRASLGGRSGNA